MPERPGHERAVLAQRDLGLDVRLGGDVLRGVLVGLQLLGRVTLAFGGGIRRGVVPLDVALAREGRGDAAGDEPEHGDRGDRRHGRVRDLRPEGDEETGDQHERGDAAERDRAAGLRQRQHDPAERVDDDRRGEQREHRELGRVRQTLADPEVEVAVGRCPFGPRRHHPLHGRGDRAR